MTPIFFLTIIRMFDVLPRTSVCKKSTSTAAPMKIGFGDA